MSPEKLIRYTRDAGCVLLGLGGIAFQIYTGNMTAVGMGTCMSLLGIAGGFNVKQLLPPTTGSPQRGGRGRSSSSPRSASPSRPSSRSDGDR